MTHARRDFSQGSSAAPPPLNRGQAPGYSRTGRGAASQRKEALWALAFLAPNLILLGMFTYRPLVDNIRLSFYAWNISSPTAQFIGLDNYVEWFTREDTRTIVGNTLVFTLCAVAGSMVLGLALAMLLDQKLKGRNFARSVVFAPLCHFRGGRWRGLSVRL